MAVFTLFAYGTWEHHEAKGSKNATNNIISKFSRACIDIPMNGMIIDGPGTLGLEVPKNAKRGAEGIIKWLRSQYDLNNQVNITGFSRGSVTSIYIANILKRKQEELEKKSVLGQATEEDQLLLAKLKKIDLNLFLIDPVAGMSDKAKPFARIIPDNVKNYVSVFQLDERRRDFKPQDISRAIIADPAKTSLTMLPLYGNHSDTTKIKSTKMESGAKLLWHSIHQFLTTHGSNFLENQVPEFAYGDDYPPENKVIREALPDEPQEQRQQLLKLFSQHHSERDAYRQSGMKFKATDGIFAPRTDRSMNQHLRFYVKQSPFFINQLERELFKVTYPATFNYLFEKNQRDERFPPPDDLQQWSEELVINDLHSLKEGNPQLFDRLKAYKLVDESANKIYLGEPRGYHHLEPLASMQQIFPHLLPETVNNKEIMREMDKLSSLETEIYRMTFRYQREKHDLNFAGKRGQSAHAIRIREDIHQIVNFNEGSTAEKPELILNKLEDHYKKLILSNNHSDLTFMTALILAKHGRRYEIEQSIGNEILVDLVYMSITLVKIAVEFIGTLGFVGGACLYAIGNAMDSFGERIIELIGDVGCNPFKAMGFMAGALLLGVGIIIKNGLGLRPLNQFVVQGIKDLRDWIVRAINTTTIETLNQNGKDKLNLIVEEDDLQESENPRQYYKNELNRMEEESDSDSFDYAYGGSSLGS
jgi:hypothetical protein